MNKLFHKLALYSASILISSLPFTAISAEVDNEIKKTHISKASQMESTSSHQSPHSGQHKQN